MLGRMTPHTKFFNEPFVYSVVGMCDRKLQNCLLALPSLRLWPLLCQHVTVWLLVYVHEIWCGVLIKFVGMFQFWLKLGKILENLHPAVHVFFIHLQHNSRITCCIVVGIRWVSNKSFRTAMCNLWPTGLNPAAHEGFWTHSTSAVQLE
jgi:hypothetical protein